MPTIKNGIITTDFNGNNDIGKSIILQPDGKLVVVGNSVDSSGDSKFALVRYNSNGSLDGSFGLGGKITTDVSFAFDAASSAVIQADGKLVVAGYSDSSSHLSSFELVRYNTNGSLDTSFGTNGKVITQVGNSDDQAKSIAIQPNGKLIAAGYSRGIDGVKNFVLVRYNADGSLDTTFGNNGMEVSTTGTAFSVIVQSDVNLVAAGARLDSKGNSDFYLLNYTDIPGQGSESGSITTNFNSTYNVAESVIRQPDGKFVAVGTSLTTFGYGFALARYNADGSADTTFDGDGKVTSNFNFGDSSSDWDPGAAKSVVIRPNGELIVVGTVQSLQADGQANSDFVIQCYNYDGTLNYKEHWQNLSPLEFGFNSGTRVNAANSVAIQPDGKVVAAGYSKNTQGNLDFALVRYNTDGSLDTTFNGVPNDGHFDIALEFSIDTPENLKAAFKTAAARWQSIITADIPNYNGIDDVKISATIAEIDGFGKVLGHAGSSILRPFSNLPATGAMTFDIADVKNMVSQGTFDAVILHEMGHALGLGSLWEMDNLKSGYEYTGIHALEAYRNLKNDNTLTSIPLENTGGSGTIGVHWRESVFNTELMTGWANFGSMPMSLITVGALQDLGYTVDKTKADPYVISGGLGLVGSTNNIVLAGSLVDSNKPSANHDILLGTFNNESISGLAGHDTIFGLQGNDTLTGGAGNDSLGGGDGTDTAIYNGPRSNFNVTKITTGYTVTDKTGIEGTDTLTEIEKITFADMTISLEGTPTPITPTLPAGVTYTPSGNAGQAFRIYKAAFDRMPDKSGLDYWFSVLNTGKSLTEVAGGFMQSAEFIAMYGANPTAENFVTKVYNNVLHRAPEIGGYNYWVGIIHAGSLSQAGTLAAISESAENQAAVLALVGVDNSSTQF